MDIGGSDALVGRTFGEFVIRERIGEGGFGAVYRAEQPMLDREAVVKVLHAQLHNRKATERFLREARLASKLDHPYAAHVYAFGAESDGTHWIAMELVRGMPLDVLLTRGPLPLERFVPLLERICEVVANAHEQGIVHRDLKPANVMVLSRAGRLLPKLLDFGIAKALDAQLSTRDSNTTIPGVDAMSATAETVEVQSTQQTSSETLDGALTQQGSVMGSPLYMAPEQWMDAASVDARTDIYALGVLCYESLTGKPPFTGKTASAMARAHAKQKAPPLGGRFPSALDGVIGKALAKRPEERYASVLDFAKEFRVASGIATEAVKLPQLDEDVREHALASAPQPIAEAVASLEAARNAHQARDALWQFLHTTIRYVGLVALASRSRVGHGRESESPDVVASLRALYRRTLTDEEWLVLARELVRPFRERKELHPVPELVELFAPDGDPFEGLLALKAESPSDDALPKLLERGVALASKLLRSLAFVSDYGLVVPAAGRVAECWVGVRRNQRTTTPIAGRSLPVGEPALLDRSGAPVLSLHPMFQVAVPTPGAPLELFLFEGRGRRGAKLVALPSQFEHHDDALWDWFRVQLDTSLDEGGASTLEERTPYRGLSAFSSDDAELFFGREALIDSFSNRLRVQPLLAVVGPSGAGKSSFVQAGVVPALPPGWRALVMRPGAAPIGALKARLDGAGIAHDALATDDALGEALRRDAETRGPILFVIDQLEELFTLCLDEAERKRFAELLVHAARSADDPVRVVVTLRDDFLLRAEQLSPFRTRLGQGLQLVTVPAEDDLVRILVEPARRAGYELEDKQLAMEMVREVVEQPGALALLSFTASKLWELRDRHFKQLTRRAYTSLGGVGGALAQHAEKTLDTMPPEERRLVREVFRHLVTSQNTRAVLARTELHQLLGDRTHADAVLEKLIAARLLVSSEGERGEDRIEIVHEALLGAWPRLVEWTREDAEGARLRDQLRAAAKQWEERGRSRGLLWRGDALVDYQRWRKRYPGTLTDLEQAFANASIADARRGRRIRQGLVILAFAALTVGLAVLAQMNQETDRQRAVAEEQSQLAQENARKAQRRLGELFQAQGRQAAIAGEAMKALGFLYQAQHEGAEGTELQLLLGWSAQRLEGQVAMFEAMSPIRSGAISPDGRWVVAGMLDGRVELFEVDTQARYPIVATANNVRAKVRFLDEHRFVAVNSRGPSMIYDTRTHQKIVEWDHGGEQQGLATTKDIVVTTGNAGRAKIWDAATGALRHSLTGHEEAVYAVAIDPRGEQVATGDVGGHVRLWRVADGGSILSIRAHAARVSHIAFDPTGAQFATSSFDGRVRIWDRNGKQLAEIVHPVEVRWVAFDPKGEHVVTASEDGTARVSVVKTGAVRRVLEMKTGTLSAQFDPSGTRVLTTSTDGGVRIWDVATGTISWSYLGHSDAVWEAAFDASGTRFVTPGFDQTIRVWDARHSDHVTLQPHEGNVWSSQFSPDGTMVVTAASDNNVRVFQFPSGELALTVPFAMPEHGCATFSPNGKRIAIAGHDGAIVYDLVARRRVFALGGVSDATYVAFSPKGDRLVAADVEGKLHVWNAETGLEMASFQAHRVVWGLAFSPDGRLLASGAGDGAKIWDASTYALVVDLPHKLTVASVAFDKAGTHLVTASEDKIVRVWRLSDRSVRTFEGHLSVVSTAEWAPDERFVLSTSHDGSTRLWDLASGRHVIDVGARTRGTFSAHFSPDGRYVVAGARDVHAWKFPRTNLRQDEIETLVSCRLPPQLRPPQALPCTRTK